MIWLCKTCVFLRMRNHPSFVPTHPCPVGPPILDMAAGTLETDDETEIQVVVVEMVIRSTRQ